MILRSSRVCAGLYGADDIEQARSDMIVGCVEDVFQAIRQLRFTKEEDKVDVPKYYAAPSKPLKMDLVALF